MDVRPVSSVTPYRQPSTQTALPASTGTDRPDDAPAPQPAERSVTAPAPDRDKTRYVRDIGSDSMVFQVFDPTYGEVLAQMPSVSALRNRAYADVAKAMMAQHASKGARNA